MDLSPDANKQVIIQLIGFAVKHRRVMMKYLEETGVYQSQHRLLMEISKNPNVSQKSISNLLDISAATVAVSLKKLESGGYINRKISETDNRLNQITLTEKGNDVVKQSREIFKTVDQRVLEGFSDRDKETLAKLLSKLDGNLDNLEAEIKQKAN